MVLNDCSFEGIDQDAVQFVGGAVQERFVGEVTLRAIGQQVAPSGNLLDAVFHPDGGSQSREEEPAGFEDAPEFAKHGGELLVLEGEVQDRAAEDHVGESIVEGHRFYGRDVEVGCGQIRRKGRRQSADLRDGVWIGVDTEDLVSLLEQVDQVPTGTASGVEHAHAGGDTSAQQLVKEVNIDVAELLSKIAHIKG